MWICILQSVLSGITVKTAQKNVYIQVTGQIVRENVAVHCSCVILPQAVQV
jgi:hypothetical protein